MVYHAESSVGITVFFEEGISQKQIDAIGDKIKAYKDVDKIKFISAKEAWEKFQKEMYGDDKSVADTFNGVNPLENSASYEVYLTEVKAQNKIAHEIEGIDGVRKVNGSRSVAKGLNSFNLLVTYVSATIIILLLLISVFLIGIGSSVLHPEASRITFLASGGKRGLAQSLFQVGGNLGGSLGPLLVALLVAPYGREHLAVFALFALAAIGVMYPICKWYKSYLNRMKEQKATVKKAVHLPLPMDKTALSIGILLILIFSKYIYMASLTSYYTFYLIHKFNVTVQESQLYLFIFLVATAIGTLLGGPIGDRVGRKYVIWASILGAAPFSLLMPHATLAWTIILSFCVGLMLSSAFPAILLYAQELLPTKLGLISGLFFGFAFGVAGIASAVLGNMADKFGIESVYNVCAYMPLLGLVTFFLPNLKKQKIQV